MLSEKGWVMVFVRVTLNRIHNHLLQQSSFTPKKSTVDRILPVMVFIDHKCESRQGFFATFVDFNKWLDSIDRPALVDILRL